MRVRGALSHTVAFQNIPILSDIFGSKPQVIPWQNVLLSDAQLQSLMTNIKDWGSIEQLGNLWQNYIMAGYEKAVPGFGNLLSGITGGVSEEISQAGQMLKGVIPSDVVSYDFRTSAMQNLLSGLSGSPAAAANTARNLGLTSLDLINQGSNLLGNAAQRWQQLASFGQTTMAPIQNMLITPEQQFSANLTNEVNRQRTQQEAANVAAAPSPIAKGLSDLVAYITAAYASHGASLGSKPPAAQDYSGLTDVGTGSQQYPTVNGMQVFGPTGFQQVTDTGQQGTPGPSDLVSGAGNAGAALPTGGTAPTSTTAPTATTDTFTAPYALTGGQDQYLSTGGYPAAATAYGVGGYGSYIDQFGLPQGYPAYPGPGI